MWLRGNLRLLLAGVAALIGGCRLNPPPLGQLEGYVQEGPTRPPVALVKVTLYAPWGVFRTQSDTEGRYRLTVPQGTYTAHVEREGYAGGASFERTERGREAIGAYRKYTPRASGFSFQLHPHDVVPGVHVDHFPSDAAGQG